MYLLESLIESILGWAQGRADIVGLALVGSRARGRGRADSDVDLVVLTHDPTQYRRDQSWLTAISWPATLKPPRSWRDADYGRVWSRHVSLEGAPAIEFRFAAPTWAATQPMDAGTRTVVRDGCEVLWDPQGILARLLAAASEGS